MEKIDFTWGIKREGELLLPWKKEPQARQAMLYLA